MTDEQMQKTIEFIIEQQAQFSANMGQMQEKMDRTQENMGRMEENMGQVQENIKQLTAAQARTDATVDRLTVQVEIIARQQAHLNEVVAVIADAQHHTDARLNALIDIVKEGRNGRT